MNEIKAHFQFHDHQPGTEPDVNAVTRAAALVREWMDTNGPAFATPRKAPDEAYIASHEEVDRYLLGAATAIFAHMPEVPDRTAALRSLYLCRTALHGLIMAHRTEKFAEVLPRMMWASGHLDDAVNTAVDGIVIAYLAKRPTS